MNRKLFGNDPTIVLPGQYYFAKEGTAHYPGIHHYGSNNWTRGEDEHSPALGEAAGPRAWSNGRPPDRVPLAVLVGDAPCIQNGDFWPVPGDLAREVVDGTDSRCFDKLDKLKPQNQFCAIESPALQAALARMIELTYDEEFLLLKAVLAAWVGIGTPVFAHAASGALPAWFASPMGDGSWLVVISGTTNFQQWALQSFLSLLGPSDFGIFSSNLLWVQTALHITTRLTEIGVPAGAPIILAGHSYGGSVATLLAARYKFWQPDRDVCLMTFGLPKIGDDRMRAFALAPRGITIATPMDIVTSLPPNLNELLPFGALLPFGLSSLWNSWCNLPSYLIVDGAGVGAYGDPPFLDAGTLLPLLVAVLAGDPLAPINSHLIETYVANLFAQQPVPAWPVPATVWALLFP